MNKLMNSFPPAFPFTPGQTEFFITDGKFSVIDLIELAVKNLESHPNLQMVSWTAGMSSVERLIHLTEARGLKARFVFDRVLPSVKKNSFLRLGEIYGAENLRLVRTHLKLYAVYDFHNFYMIESSANFNRNRRLEFFRVTESNRLVSDFSNFVERIFNNFPTVDLLASSHNFQGGSLEKLFSWGSSDFEYVDPEVIDV